MATLQLAFLLVLLTRNIITKQIYQISDVKVAIDRGEENLSKKP